MTLFVAKLITLVNCVRWLLIITDNKLLIIIHLFYVSKGVDNFGCMHDTTEKIIQ